MLNRIFRAKFSRRLRNILQTDTVYTSVGCQPSWTPYNNHILIPIVINLGAITNFGRPAHVEYRQVAPLQVLMCEHFARKVRFGEHRFHMDFGSLLTLK